MPLSADAVRQIDDLRKLLLQENGSQVTQFHFWFTDEQVLDLAASVSTYCSAATTGREE